MVNNFKYKALLFIVSAVIVFAQEPIKEKQDELSLIKNEILQLENELKLKSKKEKESYTSVENFNRQNFLLNKLISRLRNEEKLKQNEIVLTETEINHLTSEIKSLRENYSKYVTATYKYGNANELLNLVDAESFNQALLRYKYLREFSKRRQDDLQEFNENKKNLLAAVSKLEEEKKEKSLLVAQKVDEEKVLSGKLAERKKILAAIRNDKTELKKEIDAKKQAEIKIRNMISKLIEDAERKKNEAKLLAESKKSQKNLTDKTTTGIKNESENTSSDFDIDARGLSSFSALRGKLNWPVLNGKIFKKFGESKNVKLNTITLNYGIDIKASSDLNVKSVAEGIVSAIEWIPGYGSVIIITHKDEFRTVYSHLSEILVSEGDKVKAGSLIAKVGESIDGNILHFEIWNSRNNQNPELWLARE